MPDFKKAFKKLSDSMNSYIHTKRFIWLRNLTIALSYVVIGCVCFLAGFFLNRDDNLIYKNNINAMVNNGLIETTVPDTTGVPSVTTVPAQTTTEQTTTKISVNSVLISSNLLNDVILDNVKHTYSNVCDVEKKSDQLFVGKKTYKVSYDGVITAGIDPEEIQLSVDNDSRVIMVILPKAGIISHEIDEESCKITNKNDGFFGGPGPGHGPEAKEPENVDYSKAVEDQKILMEEKAISRGLYDDVYSHTEQVITDYLNRDPVVEKYYMIQYIIAQ